MIAWLVRIGIRPIAWLLGFVVAVTCALAWMGSVMFANARLDRYVAQEESYARNDALLTSANLNERLNQAVSVAQVLALDQTMMDALARFGPKIQASNVPQPERGAAWRADTALKVISERMQRTVERFDLHSLQLVNAAGDTVAEGHGKRV
jgi:C4-dicarboxylate-specific signal transduction histidine kinase